MKQIPASGLKSFEPPRRIRPVTGAQSISRAAAVLRAVAATKTQPSTLSDIATIVGLKVPTARRVLQALAAEGFLVFDGKKKTYQVGPDLIAITAACDEVFATRDILMAACRDVAAKTSDTTVLMVRRGDTAVCVGLVQGAYPIRVMTLDVGSIRPLGAGSGSLALVAFLPKDECEKILARNEKELSRFGLSLTEISAQAAEARKTGYTLNPGRILQGVCGIGLPIFRDNKVVASVSVAAIEQRLNNTRRSQVANIVRKAVAQLQHFRAGL
jgi:DNA-binding IclR family transcriptional regulator